MLVYTNGWRYRWADRWIQSMINHRSILKHHLQNWYYQSLQLSHKNPNLSSFCIHKRHCMLSPMLRKWFWCLVINWLAVIVFINSVLCNRKLNLTKHLHIHLIPCNLLWHVHPSIPYAQQLSKLFVVSLALDSEALVFQWDQYSIQLPCQTPTHKQITKARNNNQN